MTHGSTSITENSCTLPTSLPPICFIPLTGEIVLPTKLFSPPVFVLNFTSSIFKWLLAAWFPALLQCLSWHLIPFILLVQGLKWQQNGSSQGTDGQIYS